jgi:hypothetical protein
MEPDFLAIENTNIPFEDGDIVARTLPSGVKETYKIIDTGFVSGGNNFKAHYQMTIEKTTVQKATQPLTVIANNNSKINFNSTDNSINISLDGEENARFDELIQVIKGLPNHEDILAIIEEMKGAAHTSGFAEKYARFTEMAANHMTIIAPFIPFLVSLITS